MAAPHDVAPGPSGLKLAVSSVMTKTTTDNDPGPEGKGAVEEQVDRIRSIQGNETMGKTGNAHEEHSGKASPNPAPDPTRDLADNRPEDIK